MMGHTLTTVPISGSRHVRRPKMGASHQQGSVMGKQEPRIPEKKHRQCGTNTENNITQLKWSKEKLLDL